MSGRTTLPANSHDIKTDYSVHTFHMEINSEKMPLHHPFWKMPRHTLYFRQLLIVDIGHDRQNLWPLPI